MGYDYGKLDLKEIELLTRDIVSLKSRYYTFENWLSELCEQEYNNNRLEMVGVINRV